MLNLNIKIKQNLPDTVTLEEVVGIAERISKAAGDQAEIEWGAEFPNLNPKKSQNTDDQKTIILKGPLKDLKKELEKMMKKMKRKNLKS